MLKAESKNHIRNVKGDIITDNGAVKKLKRNIVIPE